MPNWCMNELIITGDQASLDNLATFVKGEHDEQELDFDKVIPYPENYKQMDAEMPAWNDPDKEAKMLAYKEKWGSDKAGYNSGGYEWCCENWGTKWNACSIYFVSDGATLFYSFDTAWSPAYPVVQKLSELFPTLDFEYKYEETGCFFAGDVAYEAGKELYHNTYEPIVCYDEEEDEDAEPCEDFEAYRQFHA